MPWSLYQRVALGRDLPEHGLQRGDIAVVLDHVPHPEGGEAGCVLEVFNALGESIVVVTVPESAIEDLRDDRVGWDRFFADPSLVWPPDFEL